MLFNDEYGNVLLVFKEDPEVKGEYTDEVIQFLIAVGYKATPDGPEYICYDYNGYDWHIPANEIGEEGSEYGWSKTSLPRFLRGLAEGRR